MIPAGSTSKRLIELDALRGIAILLVLDYHYRHFEIFFAPLRLLGIKNFGWAGVDIFFVLSGFLIGGLLFEEWKTRESINGGRFLIRRAFKIWPAYYFYILMEVCVHRHPLHTFLLGNLLNIQNYTGTTLLQTWTLAIEEQFYLALALALTFAAYKHISKRAVFVWLVAISLSVTTLRSVLTFYGLQVGEYTHTRMDGLLFGVILAYLLCFSPEKFDWLQRQKVALWVLFTGCFFVLCVDHRLGDHFFDILAADLGSVGLLLLMYRRVSTPHSAPYRLLARIGVYSYGIYLWHVSVMAPARWISAKLPGRIGMAGNYLLPYIAAILLGVILTKLIEFPFLRLREKLVPRDRRFEPRPESDPHIYVAGGVSG